VRGNHVHDRVTGPEHRLDISISAKSGGEAAAASLPHGLVGQSFATVGLLRNGRKDVYPASGHIRTEAMAEGAIDGEANLYEVTAAFDTRFAFSRFDAPPAKVSPHLAGAPAATAEASAVDVGGGAGGVEAAAVEATLGRPRPRRLSEQGCDSNGIPDLAVQAPLPDADSNGIPDAWEAEDDGIVLATSHGLFMSLDNTSYTETERGCHCGPDTVDNNGSCDDQTNGPLTVPSGWKLAPYDSAIVDEVVATHSWGTDCMIFANGESYYTSALNDGRDAGNNCTSSGLPPGAALGAISEGYYAKYCTRRVLLMKST